MAIRFWSAKACSAKREPVSDRDHGRDHAMPALNTP